MIRINQIKIKLNHTEEELIQMVCKILHMEPSRILKWSIGKRSIDARDKSNIFYVYAVDVTIQKEEIWIKGNKNKNVIVSPQAVYVLPEQGSLNLRHRPVIVGSGPAGLFCAYQLARAGYSPILLERGDSMEERTKQVDAFWSGESLDIESNVQFGEGGAGTFSDGKLNTMVNDAYGRITEVFRTFVENGAPEDIMYKNKPHIGTNLLRGVVKSIRNKIRELGGEVRFRSKMTDIRIENNKVTGIVVNGSEIIPSEVLVLAIGHSARDTFQLLYDRGIKMEQKAFAVGVRVEHPQELISQIQYGKSSSLLPPADYKLTHQCSNGRGVYSFCMCPGGYVVNASSEEGRLAVNGMSNHDRAGRNANSAIVVSVKPDDFSQYLSQERKETLPDVFYGVEFQRYFEELAFRTGRGKIPVQLFGDFVFGKPSTTFGTIIPDTRGACNLSNLCDCMPEFVREALIEGMRNFDRKIKGFGAEDVPMSGLETRTSSPVRILRNMEFESSISGIYPCGEGAGYAGGITSAAVDGLKVFEAIYKK